MNINKITSLIPASFDYTYPDEDGNEQSEKIDLKLRRYSFAISTSAFMELLAQEDIPALARFFVECIDSWSVFTDDDETEMFPISEDWFKSPMCPAGFALQLGNCMYERLSGNPPKASNSRNGSQRKAKSSPALASASLSDTSSPLQAGSGA